MPLLVLLNRVSDFVRLVALLDHGGVYLDTDVEVKKSFDPLLDNECFIGFQRKDVLCDLVNGSHRFNKGALANRGSRPVFGKQTRGTDNFDPFTGPGVLTHLLRCHGLRAYSDVPIKVEDVTVFPCRYFYPYRWDEELKAAHITPDTYAVYLWEGTWRSLEQTQKSVSIRNRILTKCLSIYG